MRVEVRPSSRQEQLDLLSQHSVITKPGRYYDGPLIKFHGIEIQEEKGTWAFQSPDKKLVTKDTYSIWNPEHWEEIARRLNAGEACAAYIMGNYGLVLKGLNPEWQGVPGRKDKMDVAFTKIKKRDPSKNFVVFTDPEDSRSLIDTNRMQGDLRKVKWAGKRAKTYTGPQHNTFPLRKTAQIHEGFTRKSDQSVACFWIPGHWGYEGFTRTARKIIKDGRVGGSSLNVSTHKNTEVNRGESKYEHLLDATEPSYNSRDLYQEISQNPDWLEEIDFIVLDEIAESMGIGRSQTMVSFMGEKPEILRIGSLSADSINQHMKDESLKVAYDPFKAKPATFYMPGYKGRRPDDDEYKRLATIEYSDEKNRQVNNRVQLAFAHMAAYRKYYNHVISEKNGLLKGLKNGFPHRHTHPKPAV